MAWVTLHRQSCSWFSIWDRQVMKSVGLAMMVWNSIVLILLKLFCILTKFCEKSWTTSNSCLVALQFRNNSALRVLIWAQLKNPKAVAAMAMGRATAPRMHWVWQTGTMSSKASGGERLAFHAWLRWGLPLFMTQVELACPNHLYDGEVLARGWHCGGWRGCSHCGGLASILITVGIIRVEAMMGRARGRSGSSLRDRR